MYDIRLAIRNMRVASEEILSEVENMPKKCIHWRPAPEVWTVMDNLCHMAEFIPYWTAQIQQVIERPEMEWGRTHHDPDRLAAVADTSSRDLKDVKEQIAAALSRSIVVFDKFTPDQFEIQASSRNPRWGIKPASFIVSALLVTHLQSHHAQLQRNYKQFQQHLHATDVEENSVDSTI